MRLRARLVLATVGIALPIAAGGALYGFQSRRLAFLEATYEATVERMESGARERCEAGLDGPRRRGRGRAARRRRRARIDTYDPGFAPRNERTPPLEPELRAALEGGEPVAAIWHDTPASRARVAMRMPWGGPCAVIAISRPTGPAFGAQGRLRAVGASSLVALLTAFAALLAVGPVVRRIRKLELAVRSQAKSDYAGEVAVVGRDEISELAQAFNDASSEIRARLEEVSARDRALTEFLASTTHDVMIPLTVLGGHLSALSKELEQGEPADPAKVRGALEEAHYLTSLLRNLSAAARLDAGEPMISRHPLDLREVVERVVARHRPVAVQRAIGIEFAVPEEPVTVVADSTLLEQALSNLVSNAVRYNRDAGHVAVVLSAADGRFRLRVLDDGPGIPEEELERVAERRFRGGDARQRRPTGLGLGLHIVRDVADKHGYSLSFENASEGGLEVTIRGPAGENRTAGAA